jgi:hypothetical protein
MDTLTFLRSVLGTAGSYCTLALKDGARIQKFYPTIEALEQAAYNFDANDYDAYFALGTFRDLSVDKPREADNVQQMRAFFMDLDCGINFKTGKPKDFTDQAAAVSALRAFCKTNRLPKPFLINSGYGVHVYWPLTEPVDYDTWLPVAERLKALAAHQDFKADRTRTADAASVLRVPGTHNYKGETPAAVSFFGIDPPKPVDFEDFAALLKGVSMRVTPSIARKYVPAETNSAMMDALLGKRESSFKLILQKTMAGKGCAQLAHAIQNRTSLDEPMWRAALSIAKHCTDADRAAKAVSEGHPGYDPDETYLKMERITGPYLCGRFDEYNPGVCDGCPNFNKIKSPIVLGMQIKEAAEEDNVVEAKDADTNSEEAKTYVIPKYPQPYFRGATGGVFMRSVDDEGEVIERMIWHNDLYVTRRLSDPEMGEIIEMRHHLPRDGVKTFVVPLYVVTSKDEYRKVLSAQGVIAINKEVDAIMAYTQQSVKELQMTTQADNAHRQFGWLPDFKGFVLGDKVVFSDHTEFNAPSSGTRGMLEFFESKGTLDGWKDAINFYNRPGFELHQFITCAGFGSVLMKFMPINAALLHIWSKESGFGKTHAMFAALSSWGDPNKLLLIERDTHNSRMNRADVMHNLPVCMDEITNIKPTDASDMIYQITGGKQKNRMSANGNTERYRGDPWNLLFISSANCSLIDKVAMAKAMPKAEAQRVLEIETSKLFNFREDKVHTDAFSLAIQNNYGHAGIIFVQYVMAHMAETKLLVETLQRQIDKAAGLGPENRFWSAACAVTLAAAVICKHLGLIDYDVKVLQHYTVDRILGQNKLASEDMSLDPMDLITSYTYQNIGRILQIKSTIDRRKKGDETGIDDLVVPDQQPRTADIIGRYETDLHVLYLLPAPFRDWLADRQVNYNSVLAELKSKYRAERRKVRLTKGTKLQMPVVDAIEIPIVLEDSDGKEAK